MTTVSMTHEDVLSVAHHLASAFLGDVKTRHVGGTATRRELLGLLGGRLPHDGADPTHVIERLAENADSGIVATTRPRYFGFVTGGAIPVTVAAEWLVSTWDQNAILYIHAPAVSV